MIQVTMPSNIALIKYMGKNPERLPINASLSWTLPHLYSTLIFEPAQQDDLITNVTLKPGGKQHFLKHFQWLKKILNITQSFHIHSENNFPSGTGIASSASSYSALTQGAYLISQTLKTHPPLTTQSIAQLSAKGSGSSIRSFYSPYSIWTEEGAKAIGEHWPKLESCVAIIDPEHKKISSSEAHQRVMSCTDIHERVQRANARLDQLMMAFNNGDWASLYHICKDEFLDMHHLFHTCHQPFRYITPHSQSLIHYADGLNKKGIKLIMTMDAGANVHFLYPTESISDIQALAHQFTECSWRFSHV